MNVKRSNQCKDCSKAISFYSTRCRICSNKYKAKKHTKESRMLISKNHADFKGKKHPNYKSGKSYNNRCVDCNKKIRYGSIRCKSCSHKGKLNINYGVHKTGSLNSNWKGGPVTVYCKECNKLIMLKKHRIKKSKYHFCSKSCSSKFNFKEKRNPNWKNGLSKEPYSLEFNNTLKNKIRKRDEYTCQICGMSNDRCIKFLGRELDIHHINYIKKDCRETNLISLCQKCHIKTNYNRPYWIKYLQEFIDCIKTGKEPLSGKSQILKVAEIMDQII